MAEYYEFQDVVVRFDVFEDGEDITPRKASVLIYGPDKEYLGKDVATVLEHEVRYILTGNNVVKTGQYTFVFKVSIYGLGDYTHIVRIDVEELPVPVPEQLMESL